MQRLAISATVLLGALLTGCYPEGPEYIEEYDLVYTDHSPTYDFTAQRTYSLPDSVVKVTGDLDEGEAPDMVKPVYGNEILQRIRDNMNTYGWTEVAEVDSPDVVLLPSVITSTTVTVWYPSYYWGWYYPWYGGWYYPGYYPPTVSSYTTGSLIIQMVDADEVSATDALPVNWLAVVNGLMEGSTASIISRIDQTVDQAFTQSEYLKK